MVALIPPLLLAASFMHLAAIGTSLPGIDPAANAKPVPPHIMLRITASGLAATCTKDACAPLELAKVDGAYDWTGLEAALATLKETAPKLGGVVIGADDTVLTQDIVDALHATRMYPNARFTAK